MSDDAMSITQDGTQHVYMRDGSVVRYTATKPRHKIPEESLERTYKSEHAAVCAFGRLRAEPEFRTSWKESVQIENIRKRSRKRSRKNTRPFTSEALLLALLGENDAERLQALEAILPPLRERLQRGESLLEGASAVRQRLRAENEKPTDEAQ